MAVKSISFINEQEYNVYVTKTAHDKMRAYTELCEWEIGWFGLVRKVENKGFLIDDVYLLKQEVHAATTEIDPQATIDHFLTMTADEVSRNRLWGHSHVNMGVTPSGQDESQAKEHYKDCEDFYIRLITNKKDEYHITIYDMIKGLEVIVDSVTIYDPEVVALRKQIAEEIKEKVSYKKAEVKTTTTSYFSSKYSEYDEDYYKYSSSYYNSVPKYNWKRLETSDDDYSTSKGLEISKMTLKDILDKKDYEMDWLDR